MMNISSKKQYQLLKKLNNHDWHTQAYDMRHELNNDYNDTAAQTMQCTYFGTCSP